MRKSQDFIIEKLDNLFDSIAGIRIRYEFREYMAAHFIEILPLDTFDNNQEYVKREMEIQEEFELNYGDSEEILFVSSESLNEIKNEQYSLGYNELIDKISVNPFNRHSFSSILETIIEQDKTAYRLAA